MSAPDVSGEMMKQFVEAGASKHLTLLIGAGASMSAGLPDWDELAVRLLMMSNSVPSREAAELLVKRQDPLLVAEAARKAAGENWNEHVQRALYEGAGLLGPTALHLAAAGHVLAGEPSDTTLVTLNFDTLLEMALTDESGRTFGGGLLSAESSEKPPVHHLHGTVTEFQVEELVLTLSDFNELMRKPSTWQQTLLQKAIGAGAIVIAGTSYRDPDLRQWLHVALEKRPAGHRAIVLLAREGFKLSRDKFQEIRGALADQWRASGLEPVILEDYSDAAQIMRELRHVHSDDYLAPSARARMIWDAHTKHFEQLQQGYSDFLIDQSKMLGETLGTKSLNVTLWLADGEGNIARWAAQDRIYRSVNDLRRIASGHDSHWIAGHALASEELLFQDIDTQGARQWSTVLAVPIRVEHSGLPEYATAVLSVGLPGKAEDYVESIGAWSDEAIFIANGWSTRLIQALDH